MSSLVENTLKVESFKEEQVMLGSVFPDEAIKQYRTKVLNVLVEPGFDDFLCVFGCVRFLGCGRIVKGKELLG